MANKARYYGIVTEEQKELRGRATRSPVINKQELTSYSIYSAMAEIPNVDKLSAQIAAQRIKDIIMERGFTGKVSAQGTKLTDGVNTFTLTKNNKLGVHIGKEEHKDEKRDRK